LLSLIVSSFPPSVDQSLLNTIQSLDEGISLGLEGIPVERVDHLVGNLVVAETVGDSFSDMVGGICSVPHDLWGELAWGDLDLRIGELTLGNTSALSAKRRGKPTADSPDINTSSTEPVGPFNKSDFGTVLSCSPLVFVSTHTERGVSSLQKKQHLQIHLR
jgi:hypothetical protein